MTAPRDPDARIAAFFQTSQPDLPDRTFDAVRREIHGTRQRVVIGPWRESDAARGARFLVAAAVVVVAMGVAFLNVRPFDGPGGVRTPAGGMVFASPMYGYTITMPPGWIAAPAIVPWDGTNQPGPDAESDKFAGPQRLTVWAFAGPYSGDLPALVADRIAANARDHADTCPADAFKGEEPLQFAGEPWTLLSWDCGALINQAITVRAGIAYAFTFRDLDVRAATDPADRAIFQSMLDSVELPDR